MTAEDAWSTVADVERAVRRRWEDGSLLRAFAEGLAFPAVTVPLRGPGVADLGERFASARAWADGLYRAARTGAVYELELRSVGGRFAGSTALPARALVQRYDQAWRLLGTHAQVADFSHVLDRAVALPVARAWVLRHPLVAARLVDEWDAVLEAYHWLDEHRDSGAALRTITAPGVDTKFVERHLKVFAELLNVPAGAAAFLAALGLAAKPSTVRLRFEPSLLGLPDGLSEAVLRAEELAALRIRPTRGILVENETTYLAVPVPRGGVVLWGRGYDVDTAAKLTWLRDVPVEYWSDLDTHGFAMLNRVRAHLPQVRSVLMDRDTLLAHEVRWVREATPTSGALPFLTRVERDLYSDLVTDRFGLRVRLEQERIDWAWALQRL